MLFVSETFAISAITQAIVLVWYIVFMNPIRKEETNEAMWEVAAIFAVILYIINWFGTWLWLFWSRPNIVSIVWWYILLVLVLALITSFEMDGESIFDNSFVYYLLFAVAIFVLTKFVILLGIALFIFLSADQDIEGISRMPRISKMVFVAIIGLIILTLGSLFIYTPVDNANYFDDQLTYDGNGLLYDHGLPFHTKITGDLLRVVDIELAESIMKKNNLFGGNTKITDIHLGKINGSTYWIGAVSFTGSKLFKPSENKYRGFLAVDFRDPQLDPIEIREEFFVGPELVLGKRLSRVVYDYDINYIVGDNIYYTLGNDNHMRLMVPYAVQASPYLGQDGAGIVTQEIQKVGGVLELIADGTIVKDYKDASELPDYAQVQLYSEMWLEREIDYWGRSMTNPNEFGVMTHFGMIWKSEWLMGIDDDVRVIIDPDTEQDVQYTLLDSTGSDNQILRGAIKANTSGMFYYDWSQLGFIDTNTAHEHGESVLTEYFGLTNHGYETLLPILYPIIDNPQTMNDYAYVMPLLFRDVRFGGIVVTDPADQTGVHSSVVVVDTDQAVNISSILSLAIDEYLLRSPVDSDIQGEFEIDTKSSYVKDGNTIYVMQGNLTIDGNTTYETIVFRQDLVDSLQQWLLVVNSDIGDTITLKLTYEEGVLVATSVTQT